MTKVFLIVAAVADLALAALLIAVSGFIIGGGPQSMNAGGWTVAIYTAVVLACLGAPVAGFILNRYGKFGLALVLAWLPPAGAILALAVPAPY